MATIGLSKPIYAKYSNAGTTVTYSDGGVLGKYTEMSIELEDGDDNILYGDNAPAESDQTFTGGSFNLTTDDLRPAVAKVILGLAQEAMNVEGVTTEGAAWLVHNDSQEAPYLGVGGIIKKKVDGVIRYVAFILLKVQFTTPGLSATTQGETVEWQTPELSAKILRSDAEDHRWFMQSTFLNSEGEAEAAIQAILKPAAAQNGGTE